MFASEDMFVPEARPEEEEEWSASESDDEIPSMDAHKPPALSKIDVNTAEDWSDDDDDENQSPIVP